jgi:uncharacterized protein YukE
MSRVEAVQLRARAAECEDEAHRLDELARELEVQAGAVFAEWRGAGAESLAEAIRRQVTAARTARAGFLRAAEALRTGAGR